MEHHSNKEAMEAEHHKEEHTVHGAMHVDVDHEPPRADQPPPRDSATTAAAAVASSSPSNATCTAPKAVAASSSSSSAASYSPPQATTATPPPPFSSPTAKAAGSPSSRVTVVPTPIASSPSSPSPIATSPINQEEIAISDHIPPSSLRKLHRKNKKDKKKMAKEANLSVDQLSLEENEVSNSTSKNKKNTKIEYINNKIKFVLGSSSSIQTEKEIDLFLEKLYPVLEKENDNPSKTYKLIQDNRQPKDNNLSPKEPKIIGYPCDDPGPFSLGVNINNHFIPSAFIDTGSSVNYMSKDFYDMLELPKLKPKNHKLVGIIDELPMIIGDFIYPTKFLVLNIPMDLSKKIVLGRPFLNSSGAELSMRKGTIKLFAGGDHMRRISMLWNLKSRDDDLCKETRRGPYLKDLEVIDRFVHIEEKA